MRMLRVLGCVALSLGLSNHVNAEALKFSVQKGTSKVQFVSDATLERITGVASGLSGEVTFDPDAPARSRANVKLDVASLHTGLDLRDEHLRGPNWLDAKQFPGAVVSIIEVAGAEKLSPDQTSEVAIKGRLTLHGVTRALAGKAKVRWTPGNDKHGPHTLHVQATFIVRLEDHGVSIPSIVSLKVAREILVNVDLYAHAP